MVLTLRQRLRSMPPLAWLLVLAAACLVLFLDKAVHIDDTLFLRAAQQIQKHPTDFYGFTFNWFGTTRPMIQNFDNPPLACYYLAAVARVAGWSEPALHLAFLLPALAAIAGIFTLASFHCARPFLAGMLAVLTPVFLVSAGTLMCDILLLAFWVWALVWFEKGLRGAGLLAFVVSGALAGLAVWTKFTGLALVPLLGVYGLCRQRRAGWWLLAPLLPLAFAAAYEWVTYCLYGKGLLLAAVFYSRQSNALLRSGAVEQGVIGLSFAGGSLLPLLFFAPWLWARRLWLRGLGLAAASLLPPLFLPRYQPFVWRPDGHLDWLVWLQSALLLLSGLHLVALAVSDFRQRRDSSSLLLVLWMLGIFAFATAFNWTINARSILPMLPAAAIVAARRLEARFGPRPQTSGTLLGTGRLLPPALAAASLSLLVAGADYSLANSSRTAARELCAQYSQPGRSLWFEGHWGFQYYMEQHGAKPLQRFLAPPPGDILVIPLGAVNFFDVPTSLVRLLETRTYTPSTHWTTMSRSAGAGFYAAVFGPLPFVCGRTEPQRYYVFEMTRFPAPIANTPPGPRAAGAVACQLALEQKLAPSRSLTGAAGPRQ